MPQNLLPPTLYDLASPNHVIPDHQPIAYTSRSPPSKPFSPRFLDLDDPGPDKHLTQESLIYDDSPPSGPILKAIMTSNEAAGQRTVEADVLFGPIAGMLDQYCSNNSQMPVKQARALKNFQDEIVQVAAKHFESYIRGMPVTNRLNKNQQSNLSPHNDSRELSPKQSYANVVKRNTKTTSPTAKNYIKSSTRPQTTKIQPDDRLFLRLPENSALRAHSGYALQTLLKSKLGSEGNLISSILPTKSGFAISQSKGDSIALEKKLTSANFFGDARIENASPWTSYRISNVPRSFGSINEDLEHCLMPVTTESIHTAIPAAAGTPPISVTPSRNNEAVKH